MPKLLHNFYLVLYREYWENKQEIASTLGSGIKNMS